MNKLSPNLIVDDIETSLPFWVDRLGFEKSVEVPDGGRLGFVILTRGGLEVMLQTKASLRKDVPILADRSYGSMLYLEVPELSPIREALRGLPLVVPERTTAYGATELIVEDPAGNELFFAAH